MEIIKWKNIPDLYLCCPQAVRRPLVHIVPERQFLNPVRLQRIEQFRVFLEGHLTSLEGECSCFRTGLYKIEGTMT